MKSVASKVVKSAPFVERRFRNDPAKNKYRGAEDTQPKNIAEGHAIRYDIYKIAAGSLKSSNNNNVGKKFLDYYA